MYLQIAIALILFISLVMLFLWFAKKKKALFLIHNQNIIDLENSISKNGFQINFRNSNLNKYDFLKYNLNEALVAQLEIQT